MRLVWGAANPLAKLFSQHFGTAATGRHHALMSISVGFVDVQPGFLQLLLIQTLVKVCIIGFLKVCSLLWYKI